MCSKTYNGYLNKFKSKYNYIKQCNYYIAFINHWIAISIILKNIIEMNDKFTKYNNKNINLLKI